MRNIATASTWVALGSATVTPNVTWNGGTWTKIVPNAAANGARLNIPLNYLVDGTTYTIAFDVGNGGASSITVSADWCDASSTSTTLAANEIKRVVFNGTLADYTTTFRFLDVSAATGAQIHVRDVLVTAGANKPSDFFNGDTAGYEWDGTPNQSTSSKAVVLSPANHAKLEVETTPGTWTDITGPTKNITISREDAVMGTMGAEVLDATLDPTTSNQLRLGKAVRVRALNTATDTYDALFTGVIDNINVTYTPREKRTVNVSLTASDNVSKLSNTKESRGVATTNELRWLVTGVPFKINGQTTAIGTGTVVSGNDNATLWDTILITKDTVLGYAWVDKSNVLNVVDTLPASPVATMGPNDYIDLDVDFDLSQIINSVTVNWMRYNSGTQTSASVPHGPYKNTTSITEWGERSASFTVYGSPANELESVISSYATNILNKNSTAVARPKTAVMSVKRLHDLKMAHTLDLNSMVSVVQGSQTNTMRVSAIRHAISAETWDTQYDFALPNSVSNPSAPPPSPTAFVPPNSIGTEELDDEVTGNLDDLQAQVTQALADAEESFNYADSKTQTFYQTGVPVNGSQGDVWFDTDDSNKIYVYNNGAWVSARDAGIGAAQSTANTALTNANQGISDAQTAFNAANAAQTTANTANTAAGTAQTTANNAQTAANTAQTTANGKNKVTYSTSAPVNGTSIGVTGDLWFVKSGTTITAQYECTSANTWASRTLTDAVIANVDAGKVTTGFLASARIQTGSLSIGQVGSLQTTLDGKETPTGAQTKADAAQSAAISSASTDATTKANNAQNAAQGYADTNYAGTKTQVINWTYSGTTNINGGAIQTDTIDAVQIAANAITSKHTLTGPLIQTTATASRGIKLNSSALIAYNASGTATLSINATDGSISMLGALTSGSTVTGATVTGGTIQSESTANRGVKITSSGLTAYNSAGSPTFNITGSTGAVVMTGDLQSGSTVTGATITASSTGVIQTESTSSRGIKMNSAGFTAYDSAGSPTFTITASTGAVAMKGSLTSGSSITGASITSGSISGTTITGTTMTGGTIQTASSGKRIEISGATSLFYFYSGASGESPGFLDPIQTSNFPSIQMRPGTSSTASGQPDFRLNTNNSGGNVYMQAGSITLGGATQVTTGGLTVSGGGASITGPVTANDYIKAASDSINITAINTLTTKSITFGSAFPGSGPVPTVTVTLTDVSSATAMVRVSVTSVSRSGFTVQMTRDAGTGSTGFNWIAVAT